MVSFISYALDINITGNSETHCLVIVGSGDHDTNSLPIKPLAPQCCKDANSEEG